MAVNYDDVLGQLRGYGLLVDSLIIGGWQKCKVEGSKEKRGWYHLHEVPGRLGDMLIVGAYGIWYGNENNSQKVELRDLKITAEMREAITKRMREDRKRAERERAQAAARAAARAAAAWAKCLPTGESDYLVRKGVQGHGVRYSPSGALVIPMLDGAGAIHGLQIIRGKAKAKALDKEYWPAGLQKQGHYHLIGTPVWVVLVAEGYATAASLHEATGLPTAVAFDAGNLGPVSAALRKRYRNAKVLICADDDTLTTCPEGRGGCGQRLSLDLHPQHCPACGFEHRRTNAGVTAASAVALAVSGAWARPQFSDVDGRIAGFERSGRKLTDFNDLHMAEGLHVVRSQVEGRLLELGWSQRGSTSRAPTSGGAGEELRPIASVDELLERYSLIYAHGGTVFDAQEHEIVALTDLRDACASRDIFKAWSEHPGRRMVRLANVGFDPTEKDPEITCNLWGGWPTKPRAGDCSRLLELLWHMCGTEKNRQELYHWILCFVAYPLQHPGAKVRSAIVIHGLQGTGKSAFFETVADIYGRYGGVIGQHALEDKHNDWASKRLFLIADEIISRSELYHVKNTLKSFITGKTIRINPKHQRAHDERNHCNIVFLSNEPVPTALEEDDRRHAVLWTADKLDKAFYDALGDELRDGGGAALHDYLLRYECKGFHPDALPPMTEAKARLINQSLDSTSRFWHELMAGDVDEVKPRPALSADVYELYKSWCPRVGARPAPMNKLVGVLELKHKVRVERKRYITMSGQYGPHSVMFLGGQELPPGKSEGVWLGEQIEYFRQALRDYQGRANG